MLARYMLSYCVRPSVRPSVIIGVLSKRLMSLAQTLPSGYPTPCYTRIRTSSKIRVLPSGTLSKLWTSRKFRNCKSTITSVVNLGGRSAWYKLATVIGRQLITLSVHLCVQHDGREAVRRAGLSASAETCSDESRCRRPLTAAVWGEDKGAWGTQPPNATDSPKHEWSSSQNMTPINPFYRPIYVFALAT